MHAANVTNTWKVYYKMVTDALAYYDANPGKMEDFGFVFGHTHLKMNKDAFGYMNGQLADYGMNLKELAMRAKRSKDAGRKTDIFTNDELRFLAVLAQTEITKETSPLTRPTWVYTNKLGRISNNLVGWSIEKWADVVRMFRRRDDAGKLSYKVMMKSMAPYVAILPMSIAWGLMREEWEEEAMKKKANALKLSGDKGLQDNFMAMLELTSKVGTLGIMGDFANAKMNPLSGRKFTVENRVYFVSLISNMATEMFVYWPGRGYPVDWQNFGRPLLQNLGGAGLMEFMQVTDGMFGVADFERQVTRRLNTENWLRSVGNGMNLDIKRPVMLAPRNQVTPHIRNMSVAAMSNDSKAFTDAHQKAIESATEREIEKRNKIRDTGGRLESKKTVHEEAVEYVRARFRDHHPVKKVFITQPTDTQYRRLIQAIPDGHRQDVEKTLELYNQYGGRIGVQPARGKEEKKPSAIRRTGAYRPPAAPTYENMRRKIMRRALGY